MKSGHQQAEPELSGEAGSGGFSVIRGHIFIQEIWLFLVLASRKYAQLHVTVCIPAPHYSNRLQLCNHMGVLVSTCFHFSCGYCVVSFLLLLF